MIETILGKSVEVIAPKNLYKWASVWGKVQKNYYPIPVHLRREKQIEDFVKLNGFEKLYIEKDTDILKTLVSTDSADSADLVIITDQKFSRLPCHIIVEKIQELLTKCPRIFLCLNRHYINIDSTYINTDLSQHFPLAVTQWLKSSLPQAKLVDMSLDYLDRGDWFTWVVPDRIYYIERNETS